MNHGLRTDDVIVIKDAFNNFKEIDQAILFGSRALGTFEKGSDIDIALKGSMITPNLISQLKIILDDESTLPYFFDILDYKSIKEPNLIEHIDKHGILFFER